MSKVIFYLSVASEHGYAAATGTITARPTDATKARRSPHTMALPDSFTESVGADGTAIIDLPPTDNSWSWKITIDVDGAGSDTRHVLVPELPYIVNFWDLPAVNPDTLEPLYEADPAWYAALNAKAMKPGPPGDPGPEGKSAYMVWLDNGNTGTYHDYYLSLMGRPGPRGHSAYEVNVEPPSDMDNVLSSGYMLYDAAAIASARHAPTSNTGMLQHVMDGKGKFRHQIYTASPESTTTAAKVYSRAYAANIGWSPWATITTS